MEEQKEEDRIEIIHTYIHLTGTVRVARIFRSLALPEDPFSDWRTEGREIFIKAYTHTHTDAQSFAHTVHRSAAVSRDIKLQRGQ